MNVYAKFRCAALRIKKALGIFGELMAINNNNNNNNNNKSGVLGPPFRVQQKCIICKNDNIKHRSNILQQHVLVILDVNVNVNVNIEFI